MAKANNPLLERLKKASKMEYTSTMSESKIMTDIDVAPTDIPALNIALGGSITSGVQSGLTIFAGVSGTFKSVDSLFCAKAYLDKHDDAVMIFYDSEMGSSVKYFNSVGIDTDRVIHIPVTNVEELKFDIMSQLEEIKRGDHVVIVVDSIGNLASKKEVEDTLSEKSSADMTRAKQLKSLTRMITPHLNLKNIPVIMVNHVYSEIGCLRSDTRIITKKGVKKISDIEVGDLVATPTGYQEVNYKYTPSEIPTDGKRYYRVLLEDGTEIFATGNHKFMDGEEWKRLDEFGVGKVLNGGVKIVEMMEVAPFDLWDISVPVGNCFILHNGVVAHNSMYPKTIMGGGCVVAGTQIRMADGTLRNIEDVKEGELVQTLDGSRKIEHVWTPETLDDGAPECYEVEFEDGTKVICSENHKFMKDGEWVEISFLQKNDDVATL